MICFAGKRYRRREKICSPNPEELLGKRRDRPKGT